MIQQQLTELIEGAIKKAQKKGDLPAYSPPPVVVERPKQPEHGDFSTNVAMQSARFARMAPMQIAQAIVKRLPQAEFIGQVEVAPPGFINVHLAKTWLAEQVERIREKGERWADIDLGQGKRVQVEFVSANPTGPLHVGTGRNAVIGDTVANVLDAAGYNVQREYYVNDAGSQMRAFGATLYARYAQALGRDEPVPENGYHGYYMVEMGEEVAQEHGDTFLHMLRDEAVTQLQNIALEKMLDSIRRDCERLNVHFDNWFRESSLYEDSTFARVMTILRTGGYVGTWDGAVWFKARELGGDKDEVLIRSNGEPGYFASDVAYHYNKFVERGFDWVIDVWSVDHQGQAARMPLVMKALGLDPTRLTMLLYNLVKLKRGGEEVKLSKRSGDIVTLAEVIDEVGTDAIRFMLLTRAPESSMEFDLALAAEQSNENPVYYVQYAHARIASILRKAAEAGWTPDRYASGDVHALHHPSEMALLRKMVELPEVIQLVVERLAPHHLPFYAQDLATTFHAFYRDCRVISNDPADAELTKARLKLVEAAKITLARVLHLMGMSTPERM
ncbi:MAG TPA: arginine--tRNA ligase [Anaerolineae bacterium]|nr:arginine--tRNA ligase [Anaerolineae bacterium]